MSSASVDKVLDEDELCRLASLVGTDARNPEFKLVQYVQEVMRNREAALKQELKQSLEAQIGDVPEDIWRYHNELFGEYSERLRVKKAINEVFQDKGDNREDS